MKANKKQFEKLYVLRQRADFLRVQKTGRKWVARGLILQAAGNDVLAPGTMRLGLTVSKKTSSSAVKRNRIRRRLRAAARDVLPEAARSRFDYVLIGRAETACLPYDDLKNDILWCLKKMNLLKEGV
ncbi:MAG: ribonuclease P protein component [Proteobacteria bacterium]|nr:ribonuclease P protein component [Pseudomonadota bacterium]